MKTFQIILTGDQVRVGDRLLGYRVAGTTVPMTPVLTSPDGRGTVTRLNVVANRVSDCYHGAADGSFSPGTNRGFEWMVERVDLDAADRIFTPSGLAPKKAFVTKSVNEYPDFCTRCGAPAYVGMFEIAHKNEPAAKACPARRK